MANVLNRTTKQYLLSRHTPDFSVQDWIINPDLSGLSETQSKYWNISGDVVTDMTPAQKAAVDSAEENERLANLRDEAKGEFDNQLMFRAITQVMLDLYNAGKKNGAPNISISQIRTRIRDKLDGLS